MKDGVRQGLKLVIFDCDGVLIDSEGPSCRATAQFARSLGVNISDEEGLARFAGKALPQVVRELEAELGHPLPPGTHTKMRDNLVRLMKEGVAPVEGAIALLEALAARYVPVRVGSNSSMTEMEAKFGCTGMDRLLPEERIHSAADMGKPKPDPAVYLRGAEMEGVRPEETVVIEDSDTGADAARRAGMSCILLRPASHPMPAFWPVEGFVRVEHLDEVMLLLDAALAPAFRQG
ncbi:HAD family phosphatase [Bombella sp. TMW 2.2559]|uniref:HAD family phosphatase n=1 Tax=Bombella dulcis TaxID=2967339 RepID=A0ABT3WBI4_9PROT|nr:HAD family phosphatase [Bombella dulcis]MCX5616450.1 HAD family phosphatase [Bombella dulcis]